MICFKFLKRVWGKLLSRSFLHKIAYSARPKRILQAGLQPGFEVVLIIIININIIIIIIIIIIIGFFRFFWQPIGFWGSAALLCVLSIHGTTHFVLLSVSVQSACYHGECHFTRRRERNARTSAFNVVKYGCYQLSALFHIELLKLIFVTIVKHKAFWLAFFHDIPPFLLLCFNFITGFCALQWFLVPLDVKKTRKFCVFFLSIPIFTKNQQTIKESIIFVGII